MINLEPESATIETIDPSSISVLSTFAVFQVMPLIFTSPYWSNFDVFKSVVCIPIKRSAFVATMFPLKYSLANGLNVNKAISDVIKKNIAWVKNGRFYWFAINPATAPTANQIETNDVAVKTSITIAITINTSQNQKYILIPPYMTVLRSTISIFSRSSYSALNFWADISIFNNTDISLIIFLLDIRA